MDEEYEQLRLDIIWLQWDASSFFFLSFCTFLLPYFLPPYSHSCLRMNGETPTLRAIYGEWTMDLKAQIILPEVDPHNLSTEYGGISIEISIVLFTYSSGFTI